MHADSPMRRPHLLTVLISLLVLAACDTGNGPTSIPNEPATPLPPPSDGPVFDSGLVTNGDFEAGVDPWIGNAANVVSDGGNLVNSADVAVAGQPFDVNLSQVLEIVDGETYTLSFKARTDGARTMSAGIGLNEEPFTNVTENVNLTGDWQTFVFEFTATGFGSANSRVLFDMGADTGLVLIDDVSLFDSSGGDIVTPIDPDTAIYRTAGGEELVLGEDYDETTFGSGSVADRFYADDETYSPSLSVFSGTGYGANIAQIGFISFPAGFLTQYDSLDFKVKGMPNLVIFVSLFDGVSSLRISLSNSGYAGALDDGWFQVSIPVADFGGFDQATGIVLESDDSAAEQFRMLLTDIGFSGTGDFVPADPGIIPDDVIYASDPDETVDLVATVTGFGTTSQWDDAYSMDLDFQPVYQAQSGSGYGLDNIVQLGFIGLPAGFATGYESFVFKIKSDDLPNNTIIVKLEQGGAFGDVLLTDTNVSTPLGNGWYQVVLPMADFDNVDPAVGVLFEAVGPQAVDGGVPFSFLATDIGFNVGDGGDNGGGDGGGPGPELLTNGGFETSGADKAPWINAGTVAVNNFYTATANDGEPVFQTNLSQVLNLTGEAEYVLQFRARSSVDRSIIAGIGLNVDPFTAATQSVPLTTEWQSFSYNLTASGIGGPDSRVLFDLGGVSSTVDIDDVSLTLAAGSGELLTNGDFQTSTSDKAPWINAGDIATNNFYTATANDGEPAFQTNLSQVLDLTGDAEYILEFRARASVARDIIAGIGLNVDPFTAATQNASLTTDWQSFSYNLTATGIGGPDSRVLFDMGGIGSVVDIDDVSLRLADGGGDDGGGGGGGGGSMLGIVPDGDFENGVLNDPPWKVFPQGGVAELSTAQANGGMYSARLFASVPAEGGPASFPTLKVERLEEGNLAGGESVTVSFDAIAVTQLPGAVPFFVELFTELGAGGAEVEFLIQPPTFLTDTWQTYSFDTTLGADAGGGVSLSFKADCGAAPGCQIEAFVDNVSIVIN